MNKCKYCGSENLILEPRVKGQDVLIADMVALKCGNCGKWLKWCPKNERKNHINNIQVFEHIVNEYKPAFCVLADRDCEYMREIKQLEFENSELKKDKELLKSLIGIIDLIMHDKQYRFEDSSNVWYSRKSCKELNREQLLEELEEELHSLGNLVEGETR